jgi:DNA-binding NarL/FixJ family response regulator
MKKINVIVADDHRIIRQGLKLMLSDLDQINYLADAEDGEVLLSLLQEMTPDVILLDINMPKLDGITAIQKILAINETIGIIMLSGHEDPDYIRLCDEEGASSFLPKDVEREVLIDAILTVAKGEKFYTPKMKQRLVLSQIKQKTDAKNQIKLTRREKEVLVCLGKGLSTKQIADELFLSNRTVETHRLHLLKKFDAQNATELVRLALSKSILTI